MQRPKPNPERDARILGVIALHRKENPIKIQAISERFGIHRRAVDFILDDLRAAGHKIGSSKTEPTGVFLARNDAELLPTIERFQAEIDTMKRKRDILLGLVTQPSLFSAPPDGIVWDHTR